MYFAGDADDLPDFVETRDHLIEHLVTFVRALRGAGVEVPANASIVGARALVEVGFDDEDRARAALRAALVSREEDLPAFERLFPGFWARLTAGPDAAAVHDDAEPPATLDGPEIQSAGPAEDDPAEAANREGAGVEPVSSSVSAGESGPDAEGETATTSVYSPSGRSQPVAVESAALRRDDDLGAALGRLTDAIAGLRGRRWARGGEERIDPRRALRRSFGTGGAVLSLPRRERTHTAVRAVMLVDVSQSVLDTIDRGFLVRFLRRATAEWRHVRVFFFDTSVREVTDAFETRTADAALRALDAAEAEWGGGTRIGNAITAVRNEHPDAVDRDTVVFVVSDGLEVGEIEDLEAGMAWLSRSAGAVLWLNPLAASPEYEPACRGMEVSLPYVDGLFAFTGPDDVAEIARQLTQHGLGGNVGFEHDIRRGAEGE